MIKMKNYRDKKRKKAIRSRSRLRVRQGGRHRVRKCAEKWNATGTLKCAAKFKVKSLGKYRQVIRPMLNRAACLAVCLGRSGLYHRFGLLTALLLFGYRFSMAQADGNAGISEATSLIKGYFNTGIDLMYAIGAVVGLIGAIKVYNKWSAGDPDTTKVASSWFGACIFLVVVATVLKSFFKV